ncbi:MULTISPECIES: heme ABC transporter ATP-binding protein [Roseobacteraceae]|uniref:Hemin importer ATP-binding subunit n=1 Tax=Celeribacter baekdonensis B30 TaxID=1208323 RepID=K2JFY6_9RHOB|nr:MULTISPECIES: heme ABC transporter ATP-binding protein [Roseobacteraceae]EKE73502.1 hemin importer ATP-binding subunit [Celeribacter baekdonensis B30]KAB6717566.1 heme ABC transporter ATP-binding protein [Roseobacter sp. TSBP12]|tara:strand:- start:967 stop:1800 length:834 start_codon:yes stop_codon:yes gene_type:complete
MLEAHSITVTYGSRRVLDRVDFTAKAGEMTAIVGPNGSGKTTLLKAITGEINAGGVTRLDGQNIAKMSSADLATRRAVLPQSGHVAFPFTVLELVRLGLTRGFATSATSGQDTLPHQALARVGLSGFEGRSVQELSGGERQRVQLARVLLQIWEPVLDDMPRWLFLDEPVSALDIGHQLVVMQIAHDFAQMGGGVVAVMHDLNLTAMFADRVTLLDQGRVQGVGTPKEVFTDAHLSACYGCTLRTNTPPPFGGPWILPQAASHHPNHIRASARAPHS